jgi:hypothetical protein
MKSERRHELQQNELAGWLTEKIESVKPHATQIALAAAAVVVLILAAFWYFRGDATVTAGNWSSYFSAMNQPRDREKALEEVNTKIPGTPAALWAKMSIGDSSAEQGGRAMFTDRPEALKQLQRAEAAYKDVEARATDPSLKARAQLGLGKVYESLCKPEEARKYYELAAQGLKGTSIGKAAEADAARMKNPDQVALLEWFAVQTPKRPAPFPGMGGGIPGLPNDLPARPDLSVPNFSPPGGLDLDNIGTGTPTVPGPEFPTPGTTTPGTTPPGTTPPGTTSPGTTSPNPDAAPPASPATTTPPESKSESKADAAKPGEPKPAETPAATPKTESPKSEP